MTNPQPEPIHDNQPITRGEREADLDDQAGEGLADAFSEYRFDKSYMVEITYTAILPVSVLHDWHIGHRPKNLAELYQEVVHRRMRGQEVVQGLYARMAEEGRIIPPARTPPVVMTAGEFQAWQDSIRHQVRDD